VENAWLKLGSSAIAAAVTMALVSNLWPAVWLAGQALAVYADRSLFKRLLPVCGAGRAPASINGLVLWTAAQSVYGNSLAIVLWFSPYAPGQTLAAMYLCGALANAAVTLRASPELAFAGLAPTIAFLVGLPIVSYVWGGAYNSLDLMPLIASLLMLGYGVNLWRSLLAADAAQAQAEAAVLRERQAAAAAAAAKSTAIQRMNDELRTPMAALAGAAEHLRRAATSPEARAHIATLLQANEVLRLALNDLTELDQLENGTLRIEPKPASPRQVLRSVVSAFRAAAQDKGLELFIDASPDTPGLVEMDAARVRQILFNLMANAIRYTAHGGIRISLDAAPAKAPGKMRLAFTIADTGAGMSRAHLALVFKRERATAETDAKGLGLAISLRLARLMGGELTAQSELGEGSAFTFTLDAPVVAENENAAPSRQRPLVQKRA
jgi:signal transduction histidine kinase